MLYIIIDMYIIVWSAIGYIQDTAMPKETEETECISLWSSLVTTAMEILRDLAPWTVIQKSCSALSWATKVRTLDDTTIRYMLIIQWVLGTAFYSIHFR